MANPPKRLTDPSFQYTSAANTDIRKTFARIRREQKRERDAREALTPVATMFPRIRAR